MISVYVHHNGETGCVDHGDRGWLDASARTTPWVDLSDPTQPDFNLLTDVFKFHSLSIDDARSALQFPKVEPYPGYLYLVLHGIDAQVSSARGFSTRDIDFFLSRNYLVTVHDGSSRTIGRLRDACGQYSHLLSEGPVALLHRVVDSMVDNYRPVVHGLEERIEALEEHALAGRPHMAKQAMKVKREL